MKKSIIVLFFLMILVTCFLYFFFEGTGSEKKYMIDYSYQELEERIDWIIKKNNYQQNRDEKFRENRFEVKTTSRDSYKFNSVIMNLNDSIKIHFYYSIYLFKIPIEIDYNMYGVFFKNDHWDKSKELCNEYEICSKECLKMFEDKFMKYILEYNPN